MSAKGTGERGMSAKGMEDRDVGEGDGRERERDI